eukprot:Pgem_evm1s19502
MTTIRTIHAKATESFLIRQAIPNEHKYQLVNNITMTEKVPEFKNNNLSNNKNKRKSLNYSGHKYQLVNNITMTEKVPEFYNNNLSNSKNKRKSINEYSGKPLSGSNGGKFLCSKRLSLNSNVLYNNKICLQYSSFMFFDK